MGTKAWMEVRMMTIRCKCPRVRRIKRFCILLGLLYKYENRLVLTFVAISAQGTIFNAEVLR